MLCYRRLYHFVDSCGRVWPFTCWNFLRQRRLVSFILAAGVLVSLECSHSTFRLSSSCLTSQFLLAAFLEFAFPLDRSQMLLLLLEVARARKGLKDRGNCLGVGGCSCWSLFALLRFRLSSCRGSRRWHLCSCLLCRARLFGLAEKLGSSFHHRRL